MGLQFKYAGDQAILVEVGEGIDPHTSGKVRSLAQKVESCSIPGFGEVILGYRSLLVNYDPLIISDEEVIQWLQRWGQEPEVIQRSEARLVEIPTLYGGEWGPDLEDVAAHNGLTPQEVVEIHSGGDYLVYFLGFIPGYPFMGGMSEKIATPRLSSPRVAIPAGSVGIAGKQTGIYPIQSPGGWRLIGRTPLRLYDPNRTPPFLLQAGDRVKFIPINEDEFSEIHESVLQGRYRPVTRGESVEPN
ncbi:5-oxoprolinase subunit PxpB [Kyrpidia sp.]|uniref:5-oxoprolinase subunit PxpB n=1 Tax=Kyrpidia sp. TaxID=2073077 RepID=UPI00258783E1|nr:5-oxoprolinase subunit PxpB [Kyrpidia sp.]MCL6576132.1 5-oxoprolinase subunit PxpB [Kyrpidia sp.]